MRDDNWELINGPDAHEIEVLNYTNQINVIEALLKFFLHHGGADAAGCPYSPNCRTLCELHRTGTLFLLTNPGAYREGAVHVVDGNGNVVHEPPQAAEVPALMEAFEAEITDRWKAGTPIGMAAFALWRINWIHPFKNGNGRTARAYAYACLCLKYGFFLPGTRTVIDLIMENRPQYQEALRHADATAAAGTPDLGPMETFLERLVIEQLSSLDD